MLDPKTEFEYGIFYQSQEDIYTILDFYLLLSPERVGRYRILFLLLLIPRAGLVMRMGAESKVHAVKKMLILGTALRNVSTS